MSALEVQGRLTKLDQEMRLLPSGEQKRLYFFVQCQCQRKFWITAAAWRKGQKGCASCSQIYRVDRAGRHFGDAEFRPMSSQGRKLT